MGSYENGSALQSGALNTIYIEHGSSPVSKYYGHKHAKNIDPPKNFTIGMPAYPTYRALPLKSLDAGEEPWTVPRIHAAAPATGMDTAPAAMAAFSRVVPPLDESILPTVSEHDSPSDGMPRDFSDDAPIPFLFPADERAANPAHSPPVFIKGHVLEHGNKDRDISDTEDEAVASMPIAPVCADTGRPDQDIQANAYAAPPLSPQNENPDGMSGSTPCAKGLLHYQKWWYLREVDLSVRGEILSGTPIFMHQDTLRVINDAFSYFIPMEHVDYIRTPDGLCALRTEFDERSY